jgi:hypothetical protein
MCFCCDAHYDTVTSAISENCYGSFRLKFQGIIISPFWKNYFKMAETIQIMLLTGVKPCSLVDRYRCFWWNFYLYSQVYPRKLYLHFHGHESPRSRLSAEWRTWKVTEYERIKAAAAFRFYCPAFHKVRNVHLRSNESRSIGFTFQITGYYRVTHHASRCSHWLLQGDTPHFAMQSLVTTGWHTTLRDAVTGYYRVTHHTSRCSHWLL